MPASQASCGVEEQPGEDARCAQLTGMLMLAAAGLLSGSAASIQDKDTLPEQSWCHAHGRACTLAGAAGTCLDGLL